MGDFLVNLFLGTVTTAGKKYFTDLLAKVKENNTQEVYENALKSIHSNMMLLNELAKKTKTKVDDEAIKMLDEPVVEAAAADGIAL